MSDIIQLLPDHVANQIAAGEVVQRPASVVKELLENAIDAGATSIQLIVKEAGRQLIQVIDNGKGMSVTDARMAFERHATSKIKSTDDIFKIMTKGFRGEALASIAAVAQVELKTKTDDDEVGTALQINGGTVQGQEATVTTVGTTISVKNLFYNVPARRNFLKSNSVEFRHILDEFHRVALAHESIDFQLIHNEQEIFRLNKTHLAQRILHVFGKKLEGQLIPIKEETEIVKISGFIGKPEVAKKSRGEQFFFVNHRFIRSGYLHKAMLHAFENIIPRGTHPSYFIFLEINPQRIDINIHPTKTEIKFEDDAAIYAQLRAAAKHALGQHQITPTLDFDQPNWDIPLVKKNQEIRSPEVKVDRNYNPFKSEMNLRGSSSNKTGKYDFYDIERSAEAKQEVLIDSSEKKSNDITQWQSSYIVTFLEKDMLIIDQNRAHQLVLFNKFLNKNKQNTLSQQLLFPVEIDIDEKEKTWINETEQHWISFGFDLEISENTLTVRAIPADLTAEMILPIMSDFLSSEHSSETLKYEEVLSKLMAKSAAIKKGTRMNYDEMNHLVQELFSLEENNYTPYGKRIYKLVSLRETQKFFE